MVGGNCIHVLQTWGAVIYMCKIHCTDSFSNIFRLLDKADLKKFSVWSYPTGLMKIALNQLFLWPLKCPIFFFQQNWFTKKYLPTHLNKYGSGNSKHRNF